MASFTASVPVKGVLLALLAAPLLSCGQQAPAPAASRPGRRVILVGLDAADWRAIDPLIAQGKLPAFARLRTAGRTGVMLSEPPLLSPILWTTIATGRPPEEHGVLDFMVDLPRGGQAPVTGASRRVPALWKLASNAGRSVAVVGWWASWPAESVRGTIVSDRVAPQLAAAEVTLDEHAVSPLSARAQIARLVVRADRVTPEDLSGWLPVPVVEFEAARRARESGHPFDDPVAHLIAIVAATRTYAAIAEDLLRRDKPDLLMVYLEAIDTVSHRFIRDPRRGPVAIESAYRESDALLATLAAAAPPDTWIFVCSDHGFQPGDAGVRVDPSDLTGQAAAWHRPYGIVAAIEAGVLSGRSPASAAAAVPDATPLDIAPTVLQAAGLPLTDRMRGRVLTGLLPGDAVSRPVARVSTPDLAPSAAPAAADSDTADQTARLRALGYIGSSTTSLARQNLGEILYRHGNLAGAERELRAVTESQPQNLSAWLWLARVLAQQKRPHEALSAYRQAMALPGGIDDALVVATETATAAGLSAEARRLLDGLAAADRGGPSAAIARAILARAEGDAASAQSELRAALAKDPLSFDALSRLLELSSDRRALLAALSLFRRAAESAPGSPRHLALYGTALLGAGRSAEAEAALTSALALAPDGDAIRLDLARARLGLHKADAALATLEPAAGSAERALLRGAALTQLARWPDAAREYREALSAGAPSPDLLNALAWAELQQGRATEAAELLQRSLSLAPNQPEIRALAASVSAGSRR